MKKCKRCGDIKEDNSSKYCNRCIELFTELAHNKKYLKEFKKLEKELMHLGLRKND